MTQLDLPSEALVELLLTYPLEQAESGAATREEDVDAIVLAIRDGKRSGEGWSAEYRPPVLIVRFKHPGSGRFERGVLVGREGRTATFRIDLENSGPKSAEGETPK